MLASALTIVALPAVWLANRDPAGTAGSRPNVAAVGLPAADGGTAAADTEPVDPMGAVEAGYLEGSSLPPRAEHVPIEFGTSADVLVGSATAIYRRNVGRVDTCLYSGVEAGAHIRVVNADNGRSVECWTALRPPDAPPDELVMHPDRFAEIADLTSAPIDVEIRR
ncbi:MAG: hypothetical protein ABW195_02950 [Ilumatobacteraceae bacterium]